MTLSEHLTAGYWFESERKIADPAPACAKEISRSEINAAVQQLRPLVDRDHIARVKLAFLQRVLGLM